jgi:cytochrome c-type biogenesis protein CcmH
VRRAAVVLALGGTLVVGAGTLWAQTEVPAKADLAAVEAVVGQPRGTPLEGAVLDARTEEVGGLLRCPVCQGLSVSDSPATMAQNMKHQVRELLGLGYDEEQILSYFERSYGEFVRLEPPLRGVNWLVWLAPLAGLLVGGGIVAWALRTPRTPPGTRIPQVAAREEPTGAARETDVPGPDSLPEDAELASYVLEVRELVYGWPGGVSPEAQAKE